MKRTIAPIEDDMRHVLWWLEIALLVATTIQAVRAVSFALDDRWVSAVLAASCVVLFAAGLVSTIRRYDRYRNIETRGRRKAVVPSRYKTEETP